MKQLLLIALTLFLFSFQSIYAQINITDETIIKDHTGNRISTAKFAELIKTGDWGITQKKNGEGKLAYIELNKLTPEEIEKRRKGKKRYEENKKMEANIVGKKAPNFSVKDVNGAAISTESTKGKVVVLNFWFTSCKPCITEIPHLNKVYNTYKDNDKVVFASVTWNNLDQVNSFINKHPINFPIVVNERKTCNLFNPSKYFPLNIVLDKNGNYASYLTGGRTDIEQVLSSSIQKALKTKTAE